MRSFHEEFLPDAVNGLRVILSRPRVKPNSKLGAALVAAGMSYREAASLAGKPDHRELHRLCERHGIAQAHSLRLQEARAIALHNADVEVKQSVSGRLADHGGEG